MSQMQATWCACVTMHSSKLWLREQAALAREQEQEEAFYARLGGGFSDPLPDPRGSHRPDHAVVVQDGAPAAGRTLRA